MLHLSADHSQLTAFTSGVIRSHKSLLVARALHVGNHNDNIDVFSLPPPHHVVRVEAVVTCFLGF